MIRPVSKIRPASVLNDFQVFKGRCSQSMKTFGQPVTAAHEAHLLIRDDRSKMAGQEKAMYAIHQRSENRIIAIVEHVPATVTAIRSHKTEAAAQLPQLKAA